jgi:hypothetical protein
VPHEYFQLISVQAFLFGKVVLIAFALLSSKKEIVYKRLFGLLKNKDCILKQQSLILSWD